MVMLKTDQRGEINPLMLPFVVVMVIALGFGIFSVWAYSNYSNEKNNVDVIVAEAVAEANAEQEVELRAEFAEESKSPYKSYTSPTSLGSVKIVYPKSWSAFVDSRESGSVKLDGFFHPDYVPAENSGVLFGVRTEIDSSDYTTVIKRFEDDVEDGTVRAKAVSISGATGTRFDGEIDGDFVGAIVILPLRDRTLKIWTESNDYMSDFNRVIENLSYSP
jgi:hypothetical protein